MRSWDVLQLTRSPNLVERKEMMECNGLPATMKYLSGVRLASHPSNRGGRGPHRLLIATSCLCMFYAILSQTSLHLRWSLGIGMKEPKTYLRESYVTLKCLEEFRSNSLCSINKIDRWTGRLIAADYVLHFCRIKMFGLQKCNKFSIHLTSESSSTKTKII